MTGCFAFTTYLDVRYVSRNRDGIYRDIMETHSHLLSCHFDILDMQICRIKTSCRQCEENLRTEADALHTLPRLHQLF
jgi:hypothetical protein